MKDSPSLSDSPRPTDKPNEPSQCERCGTKTRLSNGLCVNCLLGERLDADSLASGDTLWRVLGEGPGPDQHWCVGNYESMEERARGGMGAIYRAPQRRSRRLATVEWCASF